MVRDNKNPARVAGRLHDLPKETIEVPEVFEAEVAKLPVLVRVRQEGPPSKARLRVELTGRGASRVEAGGAARRLVERALGDEDAEVRTGAMRTLTQLRKERAAELMQQHLGERDPRLRASALTGSFASVIGGGPAAAVVFSREVRGRAMADPRVRALRERLRSDRGDDVRGLFERTLQEVMLQEQAVLATEFDAVHTVDRAREVGSIEEIVDPDQMRSFLIRGLRAELSSSPL